MNKNNAPQLYILCGPTAVGKGTVVRLLCERYPQKFFLSVSATTRNPRPGEIAGKHYLFVDKAEFTDMIAKNQLLEWAQVHGDHYYGTPRQPVEEAISAGIPALLEIDLAGARQVKKTWPQAVSIFLTPPSWEELHRRLITRGTETPQEQEKRIATAQKEMAAQDEFDHIVCNDDLEQTVRELAQIMALA